MKVGEEVKDNSDLLGSLSVGVSSVIIERQS